MLFRLLIVALVTLATGLAAAEPLELEVKDANVSMDGVAAGNEELRLALTSASRDAFAQFSTKHIGRTVDLRIDGEVVASPRLVEPIPNGLLVVSGMFKPGEVKEIARRILDGTARVEVEARGE